MTTKNFVQMPFSTLLALRKLCSTFFASPELNSTFFYPSWTLFNFFSSPELCSTDSTSYTGTSFPPTYMSFLQCSIFPLKIVVWYLFREISLSISLTDIYSKCNLVSFIGISTIFPILCRGHTACARQFYGKPRSHFGQRVWPRDVLTYMHKVLGISAHQNLTLALDFATWRISPH